MAVYPIAEIFESPQGEGLHAGVLATFFRLAGCNVGKPYTQDERLSTLPTIAPYQEKCSSWTGDSFCCDTNYRVAYRQSLEFILKDKLITEARHIIITGGEPLIHDLKPLIEALLAAGKKIHIETSGTKSLKPLRDEFGKKIWITVSPKKDYLPESLDLADELKVLIDEKFDEQVFCQHFESYLTNGKLFFIQPVNDELTLRQDNIHRCLMLQQKYKSLRISTQLHKVWSVR